jgi:F-type H+-transporting ATPase subunit a
MVPFSTAHSAEKEHAGEDTHHEEEFNPGTWIVEHVVDAHEWHIADIGETHITIPLPVILYYEGSVHAFMSSEFHHGHATYKGFKLETEGENKGKIVHEETGDLPLDFSITKNIVALFVSGLLLLWIFISIGRSYTRRKGQAPSGMQSFLEPLILFIRDDVAKASIGEKNYERYMPYLLTLFFFIFLNNLLGLVPIFPGGANLTGNISITLVMAVFTFIITTVSANKNYWIHIINTPGVPWWLKIPVPLMPIVELLGVFTKPFVLMVRLFANITAGHIIVLGFMSLIFIFGAINPIVGYGVSIFSVAFALFMELLELLVAFIQAYVFTLLSALYFGMATEEHH